jgi:hypothetical protein
MDNNPATEYTSIVFVQGVDAMDPPIFDPAVHEYKMVRSKASPIVVTFYALLERPDYDHYGYYFNYTGNSYREENCSLCRPGDNPHEKLNGCSIPTFASTLTVFCAPQKRYREQLNAVVYTFHFPDIVLTDEEKATCAHLHSRTVEGECWGGASGSSQVEMCTVCNLCGATLERWFQHNS